MNDSELITLYKTLVPMTMSPYYNFHFQGKHPHSFQFTILSLIYKMIAITKNKQLYPMLKASTSATLGI